MTSKKISHGRVTVEFDGRNLVARRQEAFGHEDRSSLKPVYWSLWRHAQGTVLVPQLNPFTHMGYLVGSEVQHLLDLGVADCREVHAAAVDRLIELVEKGAADVVPFFVGEDTRDAMEAVAAAKTYFRDWDFDLNHRYPLCTSDISPRHDRGVPSPCSGEFDVMAGLWGNPQDPGQSDQEWFDATTQQFKRCGTRAVVIANAERLGRDVDGGPLNYGMLVDSAVSAVLDRGFACGLQGTMHSWASLCKMPNGPLDHTYELLLLPRQPEPDGRFLREVSSTFDMWRGGGGANGGLEESVTVPIAMEVWRAAGRDKDLCLSLIKALVQSFEFRGATAVTLEDCRAWLRSGSKIGRCAARNNA
jgi:hypothetical protein